jgi:hypothetical protein
MPMIPVPEGPSVNPSGAAMPAESIAGIEPNAFGASVGAARANEGAAIGKMGDLLEKHSLVLQNQKDEALNNEAVTKAILAEGQVTNEYRKLTGKAAEEALPKYMKDLEAARTNIRNGLPSAYVQRLFDQATMRPFGYAINNASGYAATQAKAYANTAMNARLSNQMSTASHEHSDQVFDKETSPDAIKEVLTTDPDVKNLPPEEVEKLVRQKQQEAYETRIKATHYEDPSRALKMLDKYGPKMDPARVAQLREQVTNQWMATRSRDLATQAVTEGVTPFHKLLRSGVETGGTDPYNTTLDNGRWTGGPVNLTNMTVAEVRTMQDKMRTPENRALYGGGQGSSAVGAPQVVSQTLDSLIDQGVVSPNDKFDEATQNKIITALAVRRGGDVAGLKQEWEGLRNVPDEQIRQAYSASFGNAAVVPGDRATIIDQVRGQAAAEAKRQGLNEMKTAEFLDSAERATKAKFGEKMAERRDGILGDKLKVAETLEGMEKPPTSEADFLANAGQEGTDAWNRLDPFSRKRFASQFERNSFYKPMTQERQQAYDTLIGMAQDPATRREFLDNHDKLIADADLPWGLTKQLNATARNLQKNMDAPAATDRAMRVLNNARFFEGTSIRTEGQNKQTYLHFRGAMDAALKEFQKTNAGPPTDDQIRQLGAEVKAQIVQPGRFFGENIDRKTPGAEQGAKALDATVQKENPALADEIRAAAEKKFGRKLAPGELYKAYNLPEVRRKRAADAEVPLTPPTSDVAPRAVKTTNEGPLREMGTPPAENRDDDGPF